MSRQGKSINILLILQEMDGIVYRLYVPRKHICDSDQHIVTTIPPSSAEAPTTGPRVRFTLREKGEAVLCIRAELHLELHGGHPSVRVMWLGWSNVPSVSDMYPRFLRLSSRAEHLPNDPGHGYEEGDGPRYPHDRSRCRLIVERRATPQAWDSLV
jgi:hypothetical protein